jgi:hypothetical protein
LKFSIVEAGALVGGVLTGGKENWVDIFLKKEDSKGRKSFIVEF